MYICICNAVTDSEIRSAVARGVSNMKQLGRETGCGDNCGRCKPAAAEVLRQTLSEDHASSGFLPVLQMI